MQPGSGPKRFEIINCWPGHATWLRANEFWNILSITRSGTWYGSQDQAKLQIMSLNSNLELSRVVKNYSYRKFALSNRGNLHL